MSLLCIVASFSCDECGNSITTQLDAADTVAISLFDIAECSLQHDSCIPLGSSAHDGKHMCCDCAAVTQDADLESDEALERALIDPIESEPEPQFIRADQECVCPTCSKTYEQHPYDTRWPIAQAFWYDPDIPEYLLHLLCDGTLVKL